MAARAEGLETETESAQGEVSLGAARARKVF
jgi:hypothetical protein